MAYMMVKRELEWVDGDGVGGCDYVDGAMGDIGGGEQTRGRVVSSSMMTVMLLSGGRK